MAEARNYEEYRRQVLDELGIEYVTEDITDFRRWRLKVLQGLADLITKADMSEHVAKWLDEHPDIATTIQDGEVTTVKIADEAIDSDKLADGSVTFAKLANGVVKNVTPDYSSGKLKVQFSNGIEDEFEVVDKTARTRLDANDTAITAISSRIDKLSTYVTPEMFGAVGDGVTDDTEAWQMAVNVGVPVIARSKKYKCGQINVTKNIEINCNGAEFTCTGTRLFYCQGEVVATLENESDYTANQKKYSITNAEYTSYTGFAMLKGTNNFEPCREYYLGGFVCTFKNGVMNETYPIPVTGVSIEIINPIKIHLSNIGNIKHLTDGANESIEISYGYGCTIDNANMPDTNGYDVLRLYNCMNCIISNCNISQEYSSSNNNSYLVSFANSSFCTLKDSHLFNKRWHCVTTGNIYLCYHNVIENCGLFSDSNVSIADHENAYGTMLLNSICGRVTLAAGAIVKNVTIQSIKDSGYCDLRLIACSIQDNAKYDVDNVRFEYDNDTTAGSIGIALVGSPQVRNNTYYFTKVHIKNAITRRAGQFKFITDNNSVYKIFDIIIENSNLEIRGLSSTYVGSVFDISNFNLYVNNAFSRLVGGSSGIPDWSASINVGGVLNNVYLNNVHSYNIAGTYANLFFNNLTVGQNIDNIFVTGILRGTGLHSKFNDAVLLRPEKLDITDMNIGENMKRYNYWKKTTTGVIYYQEYNSSNNTIEVKTITPST